MNRMKRRINKTNICTAEGRHAKNKKIRTRSGICLGESVPIDGKRGVRIRQGKNEDEILPEEFAEYVTGRKVVRIIYRDEIQKAMSIE